MLLNSAEANTQTCFFIINLLVGLTHMSFFSSFFMHLHEQKNSNGSFFERKGIIAQDHIREGTEGEYGMSAKTLPAPYNCGFPCLMLLQVVEFSA